MYDDFRGVDGPGAEAICSDIDEMMSSLSTAFQSLFTRCLTHPRGGVRSECQNTVHNLRSLILRTVF